MSGERHRGRTLQPAPILPGLMRPRGALHVAAAALAAAGLSLLLPSVPTTDPWGWIVWGREVTELELSTTVGGAPSWKPLPVLVTTPLSLAGDAAPSLWLLVARAGGLLSLLFAFRLAERLAGRPAGILAVAGLALSTGWLRGLAHGYVEPVAIGLLLWAVERHLAGRHRFAFLLGAAVALARPEAAPLLAAYGGLLLWRRSEAGAPLVVVTLVTIPALWLVPDWLGSGDPLHGSEVAKLVAGDGGSALDAIARGLLVAPLPLSVAALAALALPDWRHAAGPLTAGAAIWFCLLAALMAAGYPASARFFVLPAAVLSVLGAGAVVRMVESLPRARLAAVLMAAASLPALAPRLDGTAAQATGIVERARLNAQLDAAIDRLPATAIEACGEPALPRGLGWVKGPIAWELGVRLGRIHGLASSAPGYVQDLAVSRDEPVPPVPRREPVTVETNGSSFLLFAPFGPTRVSPAEHPHARAVSLASAGRWRVLCVRGDPLERTHARIG